MTSYDKPIDDAEVARRVEIYGSASAHHAMLGEVWARAEAELVEVIREHWLEVMAREGLNSDVQANAVIAQQLIEDTRQRWTSPIDSAWVEALARNGSRLHVLALPMCDLADNISKLNNRIGDRIAKRFTREPKFTTAAAQALQWLGLVEFEVMSAALSALRQADVARELTELCQTYRGEITSILDDGRQRSSILNTLTGQTREAVTSMLRMASEVASAAEQSASAMSDASRTAGHLIYAIGNARDQVERTAGVVARAANEADRTIATGEALSRHAKAIATIVELIRDVALQIDILALNATIEAARAGDAGRGFGVVAEEVKILAGRTAKALDDVSGKVRAIQAASQDTVDANQAINAVVAEADQSAGLIKDSMREQATTVTAITAAVDETAVAAKSSAASIGTLRQEAESVSGDVTKLDTACVELDQQLKLIDRTTNEFLDQIGTWAR